MGIRLQSVRDFRENHLKALVHHWENNRLSASTLQNRISKFRTFAEWIGKAGMIRASEVYVQDKASIRRSGVATVDKSWSAKQVDSLELIDAITSYDEYIGMQLRVIDAFGLRMRESICLKPHRADKNDVLYVTEGSKGRRDRRIPIRTATQRKVLDDAKNLIGNKSLNRSLANPQLSLEQAIARFGYVMKKFGITKKQLGVTSHGLRHEYANERYEDEAGEPSPVRNAQHVGITSRNRRWLARATVSEELGHTRTDITSAYCGSERSSKQQKEQTPESAFSTSENQTCSISPRGSKT